MTEDVEQAFDIGLDLDIFELLVSEGAVEGHFRGAVEGHFRGGKLLEFENCREL